MNETVAALLLFCGTYGVSFGADRSSELQIRFRPEVVGQQIGPDDDVVKFTFELLRDGKPVDALLHVMLDSPPPGSVLSTDFPIVEGTRLIDSSVATCDGHLTLEYMFPIRGRYRWNVTAMPLDAQHLSCSEAFDFTIFENRSEIVNFSALLAGLAVLGLVAGVVLAQDAVRKAALENAWEIARRKPVILLLALPAAQLAAHGPDGHSRAGEIRDQVVVTKGDRQLSLRMVPQPVLAAPTGAAAAAHRRQDGGVYQARVGELAFLIAEVNAEGAAVSDVVYTLVLEHFEDEKIVFSTTARAPSGVMNWGQQLFDGSAHRVSVTAAAQDGSFAPITVQMLVGVEAVQPPGHIVTRTLFLLLTLVTVAMVAGYVGGHHFGARRASAPASQEAQGLSG